MSELEQRVAELEAWKIEHEAEHKNLRERLEAELRSKWSVDLKAQSAILEGILKRQDGELVTIRDETKNQTPILRRLRKEQRAARDERVKRQALEEVARVEAAKAAKKKKDADELFDRRRNRVLLAIAVLGPIVAAYATLRGH